MAVLRDQEAPEPVGLPADHRLARRALRCHDDAALVARASSGEEAAFAVLMERHTPMVMAYLTNGLGSMQAAEDLAQETFLSAYRNLRQLRKPSRFTPWLMQIARSKLLDQFRSQRRSVGQLQQTASGRNPGLEHLRDPGPGPGEQAWREQLTLLVVREIEAMPPAYRAVLYPRLMGEESASEIAQRLSLRQDTVRQRLLRGMRKLRRALEKAGITAEEGRLAVFRSEGEAE